MLKISPYKFSLFLIDFIILLISYYSVYFGCFFHNNWDTVSILFFVLSFVIVGIFIYNFYANNLYKLNVLLQRATQLVFIVKSYFYSTLIIVTFLFFLNFPYYSDPRLFLFIFILTSFTLISLSRLVFLRYFLGKIIKIRLPTTKVAIVGAGKSGKLLAAKLLLEDVSDFGIKLVGFYDDNLPVNSYVLDKYKVLGNVDSLVYSNGEIDEVIISIDNISYDSLLKMIEKLSNTRLIVKVNSELFKVIPEKIYTEKFGELSVINTTPTINNRLSFFLKNVFDRLAALIALILFSPFFLVIALMIKLTSKGPVFYKQDRIGLNGKVFKLYKFRSMTVFNGEDEKRKVEMIKFIKGEVTNKDKVINEQRVTSIGRILRKFSIDELPQLINVLKGHMSLVGPRPSLPYEYETYEAWQRKRTAILPGCTGVWQVYGRGQVDFKDSVIMDLYYIHNMSPWLDLKLILKTIPVLIFGRGGK